MDDIQRAAKLRREIRDLTEKKNQYTAVKRGLEEINSYVEQGNGRMNTTKEYIEQEYDGKRVSGMLETISEITGKSTNIKNKVSTVLAEITPKINSLSSQIKKKRSLLNKIDFVD